MKDYDMVERHYYIMLEDLGTFGIAYKDKQQAINVFLENLKCEEELGKDGSKHWEEHAKRYRDMIKNGKVKVVEVKDEIKRTFSEEVLESEGL